MDKIAGWERVGWLRVDVSRGYELPNLYGVSYLRCDKAVCYPFPINWVIYFFRKLWFSIRDTPDLQLRSKELSEAYSRGYNLGFQYGWEERQSQIINILSVDIPHVKSLKDLEEYIENTEFYKGII